MRTPGARAVAYAVVGVLAVAALSLDLPHPTSAVPFAARADSTNAARARARPAPPDSTSRIRADTLRRGETLSELLAPLGADGGAVVRALRATTGLDERRVPAGLAVIVRTEGADSTPTEVVFQLAVDRVLRVRRTSDSTWSGTEERLPWTTDTIAVAGTIRDNLYQALDDAATALLPRGARAELAWGLADIYEYRVDMSRDLQPGDTMRVLVERQRGPGGAVRIGNILAARFDVAGAPVEAIRFASGARAEYYDQTGRSMRAAFLRAPLAFRRISSRFGLRKHPILGTWRAHTGTDYAAAAGTPVRAIGDGTVIFAGHRGGYGNCLEIRHRNGFVSRYGHLRGFASGVRVGRSVSIGQTVAYVGMTGLATGPHLHFEILVGGVQRDPRVALAQKSGFPIPESQRRAFASVRDALLAQLDGGERERLAMR